MLALGGFPQLFNTNSSSLDLWQSKFWIGRLYLVSAAIVSPAARRRIFTPTGFKPIAQRLCYLSMIF